MSMSNRKHSDAKRFDFCTRCLLPAGPDRRLLEHHVHGRKNDHTAIVFICFDCNPHVENTQGPIEAESRALTLKRDLLIQSRALRWIVSNWQPIVAGFTSNNMNGVGINMSPGNSGWLPPFGAVGRSGRKYYFVPPDQRDEFVEPPTGPTSSQDGLGGPAAGAEWVRFKGTTENLLNTFLDAHRGEGSPGLNLESLRQD
jgi:hypothetical protein